jgi:hypothetical protein
MPKSNDRDGRASALKNRQLNNINKSISAPQPEAQPRKSLIDRMTFPNQPRQALQVKESGKRKRVEASDMDSAQKKKYRISPTCETPTTRNTAPVRDMPDACAELLAEQNGKFQSAVAKDAGNVVASGTAISCNNTRADNKPSNSQNTALMSDNDKRNVTATAKRRAEILQYSLTKKPSKPVDVAKDDAVKASSSFPSPPPSNDNSPTSKPPISDVEAEVVEDARKKQCLTDARLPTKEKTQDELGLMNNKLRTFSKKSTYAAAPVVANPDCVLTYAEYDDDSIPILHSALIQRHDSPVLLNNPSVELKAKAYILLESSHGFTAEHMGRPPKIPKIGRTKIINNVDLYVMTDGKIYVAMERGLLLAADYLKLAGIPETTGVRFKGLKPAWVKASVAKRFNKKVCTTTEDSDAPEQENSWLPIPEGDLGLIKGAPVQVYEQHPTNGRAFGRRIDNEKLGWFDLKNLTDLNAPFPEWEGLWTSDIMQLVHADPEYDLPLSAKSDSPPRSATRLSATPPVQPAKDAVSAKPAITKVKPQSPEMPKSARIITECVVKTTDPKSESDRAHKTQDIQSEKVSSTLCAEPSIQPAKGANKDSKELEIKVEDVTAVQTSGSNLDDKEAETKREDAPAIQEGGVNKIDEGTNAKPEDGVVGKVTGPKIVEAPKPRKQLPLEPRALHDRSIEDDVDWDDDEL